MVTKLYRRDENVDKLDSSKLRLCRKRNNKTKLSSANILFGAELDEIWYPAGEFELNHDRLLMILSHAHSCRRMRKFNSEKIKRWESFRYNFGLSSSNWISSCKLSFRSKIKLWFCQFVIAMITNTVGVWEETTERKTNSSNMLS